MKKIICFLFLLLNYTATNSNPDSLTSGYGGFIHFNLTNHNADFKKLPDCPSCSPGYESGYGTGFSIGVMYESPIKNKILFSGRLSFFDYSGTLNRTEKTTVMYHQKSITGEFEHNLDASLISIGLEPGLKYNLFLDFYLNLFLHAGFVVKSDYSQYEKIIKPSDAATFLDTNQVDTRQRMRNVLSGSIKDANVINLILMPGISYELPLNSNRSLNLGIELFYSLGLTPIISSDEVPKWNANTLRLGVAVKYTPVKKEIIFKSDTTRIIDTVTIETDIALDYNFKKGFEAIKTNIEEDDSFHYTHILISRTDTAIIQKKQELKCEITAIGVQEDGTETYLPYMRIEEFISSKLQPLLNYVFFDENSALLSPKYIKLDNEKTRNFDENRLFQDSVLGVYYQLLNIVGSRMLRYPKAILRLVGCNDGYSSEKNDLELSKKRVEIVKEYFISVWKIDANRIKIETRNLPEKPSTPIEQFEKIEENRRVEILSDEYEIVKPVFMSDTVRISEIPKIKFKPQVISSSGLKKWSVRVRQMDDTLKLWEKTGTAFNLEWNLTQEPKTMPRHNYPILFKLIAEDSAGEQCSTREKFIEIDNISVSQKRNEKRRDIIYEKYSLILFDFNKADISWTNGKIIDFIKTRLKKESIVNITGHTDRTGDDNYNLKLSESRAMRTLEVIGKKDATVKGFGEQNLLYNNDVPEGRFYCRTVNIEVETPVK